MFFQMMWYSDCHGNSWRNACFDKADRRPTLSSLHIKQHCSPPIWSLPSIEPKMGTCTFVPLSSSMLHHQSSVLSNRHLTATANILPSKLTTTKSTSCRPARFPSCSITPSSSSSSSSSLPSPPTSSESIAPRYEIPRVSLPSDVSLDELQSVAESAVDAASEILLHYFRSDIPVDYKSDASPVTRADKQVEKTIRDIISKSFPDHLILGEEEQNESKLEELRHCTGFIWVIDPIDGTRAFVCGRPTFVTLISLLYDGYPVLGIINQPVTKERWIGVLGKQSMFNNQFISVNSKTHTLSDIILQATTPDMFHGIDRHLFRRVSKNVKNVVYGGDGYAYALLACGNGDAIMESDLKPWDFLALVPVIEGAGGYISDWVGAPLSLFSDGRVVAAASSQIMGSIIEILAVAEDEFGLKPQLTQVSNDIAVRTTEQDLPEDPGPGHVESMTGFGRSTVISPAGHSVRAQVKSVNSRYCEVGVRGTSMFTRYEADLIALVKKMALRGRIIVNLDVDINHNHNNNNLVTNTSFGNNNDDDDDDDDDDILTTSTDTNTNSFNDGNDNNSHNNNKEADDFVDYESNDYQRRVDVGVDETAVKEVRVLLDQVAKAAGIDSSISPPSLSDVLKFSEVLVKQDGNVPVSELYPIAKEAVIKAVENMLSTRRREGALLEEDILRRTRKISRVLEDIARRAPGRIEAERNRLSDILQNITEDKRISTSRIETEITLFADKVDYSEEIVRLASHVKVFEVTFVGSDEPIGHRLGFLLQEMNREANTLAAKASDAAVSQLAVLIKEEIEKIREQCNNLR